MNRAYFSAAQQRALDSYGVPPLRADFADRVVRQAMAGSASLTLVGAPGQSMAKRRFRSPWARAGRRVGAFVAFGFISVAAAALGVFGQAERIPVVGELIAQAFAEETTIAAPASDRSDSQLMGDALVASAAGDVKPAGLIDQPGLGAEFARNGAVETRAPSRFSDRPEARLSRLQDRGTQAEQTPNRQRRVDRRAPIRAARPTIARPQLRDTPAERIAERLNDRLNDRPRERPTERPNERPNDQLNDRLSESQIERLGERQGPEIDAPLARLAPASSAETPVARLPQVAPDALQIDRPVQMRVQPTRDQVRRRRAASRPDAARPRDVVRQRRALRKRRR